MSINALQVWSNLIAECDQAVSYYALKGADSRHILQRGAANFDQKCFPDDARELAHYKTEYYVSPSGYMDMHLKHNLAAFRHSFKDGIPQPLLFVDFGCGPMTSGLALAEILSAQTPDYKIRTAYFGVDASHNMVNKAKSVNEKYNLFSPQSFKVVRGTLFDAQHIPNFFPKPRVVVLCLSFVLAPETLKGDTQINTVAADLPGDWKKYIASQTQCRETVIIYLNPVHGGLNANWLNVFCPIMRDKNIKCGFEYTGRGLKQIPVEPAGKIALGIIRGTRK